MNARTLVARMATVALLLVVFAGLLTACGSEGAITGAALGAVVGGAIGSTYDDPYHDHYYDPYYYSVGPEEYVEVW